MTIEVIASAVITAIIAKTQEKTIENIADSALSKGKEIIVAIYDRVKGKLQQSRTDFLLDRVEEEPSEINQQVLEAEIIGQMTKDEDFAQQLEELVSQLDELPEFQTVLENAVFESELEMGTTTIKNEGTPKGKQSFGKGLKV